MCSRTCGNVYFIAKWQQAALCIPVGCQVLSILSWNDSPVSLHHHNFGSDPLSYSCSCLHLVTAAPSCQRPHSDLRHAISLFKQHLWFPRIKSGFLSLAFKILHSQSYHVHQPLSHPPSVDQPVFLFLRSREKGSDGWDTKLRIFEQLRVVAAEARDRCIGG